MVDRTETANHSRRQEAQLDQLIEELSAIRSEMLALEGAVLADQFDLHESHVESAKNLLHYLALRRHDLREIQERLATQGLSSLGRAESHVRANIEAIERILRRLSSGKHEPLQSKGSLSYEEGMRLLDSHTEKLLGPKPPHRTVRIMVTMPTEAACDYEFIHQLLLDGMNC